MSRSRHVPTPVLRAFAPAAASALFLTGCGSSDGSPGASFSASPWVLEGPDVRIGAVDDPDYAFPRVMDLAVGPEGARLYRASFFAPDGEVLGTVSPTYQTGGPRPSRPLRDGTSLAVSPASSEAIARGNLTGVPYVRTDAEGEVLATIWRRPYRSTDILALFREDGAGFTSQPFGDAPLSALSFDGGFLVVDRRAHRGEGPGRFGVTRIVDDVRDAAYAPEHLPPLGGLRVATDGTIWLERFQAAGDGSTEWWILNPDGEPEGQAHTPEGLRVLLIHGDEVWGVETDELDVDYIVRYQLDRGS